jgi:hypothetical protein
MELLAIIGGLIALIALYFCFGIVLRFLWGWWILAVGIPVCIVVGIAFGLVGAILAIVGFVFALYANNEWHDSTIFLTVSNKIDKAFYFNDT